MTDDAFVFVFLSLGGLALFILWEGWQRRRPSPAQLPRKKMEQGFVPGAASRELAVFVMAAAVLFFGVTRIMNPQLPPFSGRGALIDSVLFHLFGIWGAPAACWVSAIICCVMALKLRRERLKT